MTTTEIVDDGSSPQETPKLAVTWISAGELSRAFSLRWKTIATTVIAATLIAGGLGSLQPRVYRASAVAAVIAVGDNIPPDELYRGVEVLEQRTIISTVAALASVPSTAQSALDLQKSGGHYLVNAVVVPNTNLLRIDVDGPDPFVATSIANRVPSVLAAQTRAMYHLYGVKTMSEATVPVTAIAPRPVRVLAAGAVLGLVLGTGIVISVESFKRKAAR